MRKAEEPLIARVKDRQEDWGDVVEAMVEYAMRWMGKINGKVETDITIEAEWVEYDNRDALAEANEAKIISETMLNKLLLGVSKEQTLRELDYTEEDIATMGEENAAETNGMALLAGQTETVDMTATPTPAMTAKNNGTIGGE